MSLTVEKATCARYRTSLGPSAPDEPLMMSVGFSSLPAIFLIASSRRALSYVMSTAIDDGPLETMPNMSPSCTSSFEIRLNRSRTRPVLWNCRCKSSTKKRKMRPETSVFGRDERQNDSLWRRWRRRRQDVRHAPASDHCHRREFLLHAVFIDFEFILLEVRDEVALVVAHDDVVRDQIDLDAERGFLLRRVVADAGGCAGGCAGVCADRPAARTTNRAVDQNPFIFKFIRVLHYTSRRALRAVRAITVVAASVAASPATRIA